MRNHFYFVFLCCILLNLSTITMAQVQLVDWNFDFVYSPQGSGDSTYYLPTTNALSDDPDLTISNSKFAIYPNSCIGTITNFTLSTSTTYSQQRIGYNNYMFRLMFAGPNTITDFSNTANHKHYYQFAFPTLGYDEVKLNFSFAGGQNDVNDYLETVYSTDDGATWIDAGSYYSASGWWTYNTYSVAISARNKARVLVRLIGCTTSSSGTANFNLDYFNVTGKEYSGGGEVVDATTTITWPLKLGTEGQVATFSGNTGNYFGSNYISLGNNLKYLNYNTTYNITFTQFNPVSAQDGAAGPQNLVGFTIRPKTGLTFLPASVSFDCLRYGTDGGNIDVIWKASDGSSTTLATAVKPNRNNSGSATHCSYDLSALVVPASDGDCALELYIYALGTGKQVGVANVTLTGKISGTMANISTYNLTTSVSPDGAGSVSTFPVGNEFDEGTAVTLTAKRNFGYIFSHWANVAGENVSSENPLTLTMTAHTNLVAVYSPINTYSLTTKVEGGAKDYMLSVSPAGNKIDEKLMYEEGTTVTITASSNPILTFTNWASGETSTDLPVVMLKDQEVTASYSVADYIVGWDFYRNGSSGRVADFSSLAENEVAALNLRNAAGTVSSWLDKSQMAAGGYEGAPAAVNWKALTDKYYYQIMFSAKDFTDIKVSANMLLNYNAYSIQNCEYSLNGTDFALLGTFNLESPKVWYPGSFSLPVVADHADTVYIRWIPDYTSAINGSTSTNDGTSISAIYVTGTSAVFNDGIAPVLVNSIPSSGGTGASASGKVVLTFDEKVKISDGTTALLGDKTLQPVVSGKTITFAYTGLDYNSEYTFSLGANTVSDLAGNTLTSPVSIRFTTMSKPTVTKKNFDFIVGRDGDFKAALTAAKTASSTGSRFYIFFPDGQYNLGETTGDKNQMTSVSISNVSYIGQSAEGVILYNKSIQESINSTATLYLTSSSNNIYMQDLSLMNKMDYRTGSLKGRGVALWDQGNKNIFKNIKLLSNQDTYYTGSSRSYHENTEIHGTVDFICGGGDIFFNECLIYLEERSGNCITAPATGSSWGYVFSNCTIDGFDINNNSYRLGRSWNNAPKCVYLNTTMKLLPTAEAWGDPMTVVPSVFAEYNSMTSGGAQVNLSNRRTTYVKDATTVQLNPVLTKEQADQYTIENVLGGSDAWQPKLSTEQISAPVITCEGSTLKWADNNYVLCWGVFKDGQFVEFVTTNSYLIPAATANNSVFTVRAANEMGGLGVASNGYTYQTSKRIFRHSANPIEIKYFSIEGKRLSAPVCGITLKRTRFSDGSVIVDKILIKPAF